jgi:hypothetical protein
MIWLDADMMAYSRDKSNVWFLSGIKASPYADLNGVRILIRVMLIRTPLYVETLITIVYVLRFDGLYSIAITDRDGVAIIKGILLKLVVTFTTLHSSVNLI